MARSLMSRRTAAALGFDAVWRTVEPLTAFGREAKARAQPALPGDEDRLRLDLENVARAQAFLGADPPAGRALGTLLAEVKDVRGSVQRSLNGATLDAVELYELKRFCALCHQLERWAEEREWPAPPGLAPVAMEELTRALDPAGHQEPSFYIGDEFSPRLARIRAEKRECERALRAERTRCREEVRLRLGRDPGPGGELAIALGDPALEAMTGSGLLLLVRQTPSHLVFTVCPSPEQVGLESKLARLKEREFRAEARVRRRLSRVVARAADLLRENMDRLARLDLLLARARLGVRLRAGRPHICAGPQLVLRDGRHPGVEEALRREGRSFTPVSIDLRPGAAVVTGPNMGGKTVSLKTIGLLLAMAQYGLPVPCAGLEFSLCDFIFYSGPETGTAPGLSAFAAEVRGLGEVLEHRHQRGLVLLDEFARGTNPGEGFALAAAVLAELAVPTLLVVFATHFDGLAELTGSRHWQVRGLAGVTREVADGGIAWLHQHMDYRLEPVEPGGGTPRDALFVAGLLGMDQRVLARAQALLEGGSRSWPRYG